MVFESCRNRCELSSRGRGGGEASRGWPSLPIDEEIRVRFKRGVDLRLREPGALTKFSRALERQRHEGAFAISKSAESRNV